MTKPKLALVTPILESNYENISVKTPTQTLVENIFQGNRETEYIQSTNVGIEIGSNIDRVITSRGQGR